MAGKVEAVHHAHRAVAVPQRERVAELVDLAARVGPVVLVVRERLAHAQVSPRRARGAARAGVVEGRGVVQRPAV